jgi:hypothetical protein
MTREKAQAASTARPKVPMRRFMQCRKFRSLLDHLVGAHKQTGWRSNTQRPASPFFTS